MGPLDRLASPREAMARTLGECCDTIEECYEFMLAYAAQGLPGDSGSAAGSQLRSLLAKALDALSTISETYKSTVKDAGLQPFDKYLAFLAVLERDAQHASAAIDLVLSQPSISSQLIDNLNASIHLRALLTDFFVVDEILKLHQAATAASSK